MGLYALAAVAYTGMQVNGAIGPYDGTGTSDQTFVDSSLYTHVWTDVYQSCYQGLYVEGQGHTQNYFKANFKDN